MEGLAPWHLVVLFVVIMLFFGGKKIPEMMRGLGAGVKSFKEGMREGETPTNPPSSSTPASNAAPTDNRK